MSNMALSYKRQTLLTFHEPLGSPQVLVWSMYLSGAPRFTPGFGVVHVHFTSPWVHPRFWCGPCTFHEHLDSPQVLVWSMDLSRERYMYHTKPWGEPRGSWKVHGPHQTLGWTQRLVKGTCTTPKPWGEPRCLWKVHGPHQTLGWT
jgi:hypothetical protein